MCQKVVKKVSGCEIKVFTTFFGSKLARCGTSIVYNSTIRYLLYYMAMNEIWVGFVASMYSTMYMYRGNVHQSSKSY